jgi:hypothetical protein
MRVRPVSFERMEQTKRTALEACSNTEPALLWPAPLARAYARKLKRKKIEQKIS